MMKQKLKIITQVKIPRITQFRHLKINTVDHEAMCHQTNANSCRKTKKCDRKLMQVASLGDSTFK